ncbi:MAG: hypothetical protein JW837_11320 [Sedimentisphaerales bacterium]|nr:hypothetical protein [Sedimentisphaerales bacterium]
MIKRKLIAICSLAVFLLIVSGTVKANQVLDVVDSSSGQPGTKFLPPGSPVSGYLISGPDWGWTHTFSFAGPQPPESITSATLEIKQYGVFMYDEHEIFLDGVSLGYLVNGFPYDQVAYTTFNLSEADIANLMDGTANIWLDIEWPNTVAIISSTLTITYVPSGLVSITVDGPTEVEEDTVAQYTCTALYIDSSTSDVTDSVSWAENSELATIDSSGLLTTSLVTSDQPCQVKATLGTKSDTHDITIKNIVPKVSITASTPIGAEPSYNGLFEVSRTGSTKTSLRVYYNIVNTANAATMGVDYTALTGFVDIPVGESFAGVVVDVIDDAVEEGTETVEIMLATDSEYDIEPGQGSATVTISDDDGTLPQITEYIPYNLEIQVPRDTVIQLTITDDSGIENVTIKIEGDVVYDGSVLEYDTTGISQAVRGVCRRFDTETDSILVFQPSTLYDYEQQVDVDVEITDKGGHLISDSYYFHTVMRTFGRNIRVNTDDGTLAQNYPATAMDSDGNIWVVWEHEVASGNSDIYIGKLPVGEGSFEASQVVYSDSYDQQKPAIAIYGNKLYVVWQGKDATGMWDIFISSSTDGISWEAPVKVNTNDLLNTSRQTMPAIAIDAGGLIYVAWEDEINGNKDIFAATSLNGTVWVSFAVVSETTDETSPVVDIFDGLTSIPYIVWTDGRNSSDDIYSSQSPGIPLVGTSTNQSSPAVSIDESGVLHLLWIEEDPFYVGFDDIYYGNNSLGQPIDNGISIIDQASARPYSPSIATDNSMVFACWRDSRNVSNNNDTDIYYAEAQNLAEPEFGTNVLVNDDAGTFTQTAPAIGIDINGNPYIVWVDNREGNNDIYAVSSTLTGNVIREVTLDGSAGVKQIVQVDTTSDGIDSADDVKIEFPAGSLAVDTTIKISKMTNPPDLPSGAFGIFYEFSPSGMKFLLPITVTIPHKASECPGHAEYRVYFYDPSILPPALPWSQEGITNVKHLTSAEDASLPADVHVVQFDTDHFTGFGVGGGAATPSSGGGGGSSGGGGGFGCSVCPAGEVNIVEFFLPFIGFVVVLVVLTIRDSRMRRTHG